MLTCLQYIKLTKCRSMSFTVIFSARTFLKHNHSAQPLWFHFASQTVFKHLSAGSVFCSHNCDKDCKEQLHKRRQRSLQEDPPCVFEHLARPNIYLLVMQHSRCVWFGSLSMLIEWWLIHVDIYIYFFKYAKVQEWYPEPLSSLLCSSFLSDLTLQQKWAEI